MNVKMLPLDEAVADAGRQLALYGKKVEVARWQGTSVQGDPSMATIEVINHSFASPMIDHAGCLAERVRPNLPWADDHFAERVGGRPLNPGEQWANWPYSAGQGPAADRFRDADGCFTHTYMERMWAPNLSGIRFDYGNLADVVDLLARDPDTRQAFLPIWFPEDTGAVHQGRVPCTIGYHFLLRDGMLHCFYPIRACDFVRHFRDDIYLANRLASWVLQELVEHRSASSSMWASVKLGLLTMHIWSLHCFAGEFHKIKEEYGG